MKNFIVGQRWMSESEPELGLGVIVGVEGKIVTCFFPAAKVDRKYGLQSAPLKRIEFNIGDEIKSQSGESFIVEERKLQDNLWIYFGAGQSLMETKLSDHLAFSKPEERLLNGVFETNDLFKLRYDILLNQRKLFLSPVRGFSGPRLKIIPHQFYVASEVAARLRPRVLLSDEVGLGKTIEAGLILHHLITTSRIEKCLILVPDSLVYQWFVEMLKKFQLKFKTINHESGLEVGDHPFEEGQLFISSLKFILKEEWLIDQVMETNWDFLVVDEAHQLRWAPNNSSLEYDLVASLSKQVSGLLLLSGTPEILGLAGHYARLHLLDPNRFHDFDVFAQETLNYTTVSQVARKIQTKKKLTKAETDFLEEKLGKKTDHLDDEKLLSDLIDRHGTGRIYFRNTRESMAKYNEFFPKRILTGYSLSDKKNKKQKIDWLVKYMSDHLEEKTLLICHEKELVQDLEKELKKHLNLKIAMFHSGMNLMNRDRQAAYFADPNGAVLLLSTEIGSEGRNFEFAKNLVLFDLPKLPDLLEQRIGRLDRIGQKNDIQIHVPYIKDSAEEILFRWYHEGINAFESSPRGATELYAEVRSELLSFIELGEINQKFEEFLKVVKEKHLEIEEKLEKGQDLLVELNSYKHDRAMSFVRELQSQEDSNELKQFMLNLFNQLGVEVEDLDNKEMFYVRPGDNMYLPHFPGLESEGMSITFKRAEALKNDQLVFLSWDHPMVTGIMEFIASKEIGNSTIAQWKTQSSEPVLFEAYFLLQAIGERKLQVEKWFPPTPLRVVMNAKMQDVTTKLTKKWVDEQVQNLSQEKRSDLKDLPRDFIKESLKKSREMAVQKAKAYKDKFKDEMVKHYQSEIERLISLREINPTVSETEIVLLKHHMNQLVKVIDKAEISLDSVRFIIP